ncbi:MAG: hypothetical protein OEM05_12145 [Myxococcales bacterium]|nr:hypothetical protein [Myxococcales bacterium]
MTTVPRDRARGLAAFGVLGLATVALTWPLAVSLDTTFATHADYFSNVWNFWWVRKSLFELGSSPYWTDYLFFPDGISLAVHTLSFANSVPGALLSTVVGLTGAFNLLTLAHFWLSAWAFYLLAHYLTGSRWGSVLAGLVYSFCPFHYYYLPMINVVSMESLPLTALFFMKTYREGGAGNLAAAAACTALTAVSCWYYLPYVALLAGALTACGRLWAPEASFWAGARRVIGAGLAGGILVLPLAWPLVSASLFAGAEQPKIGRHLHEGHDLLGFLWFGPPEQRILSWPSAVGYSALLLVALGFREVRKQKTWLILLAATWVLNLGGSLRVGGVDTGFPLPYAALVKLPVLGMLRNPDRMFLLVQLSFAALCAFAWKGLAARIASPRLRGAVGAAWIALVMWEFSGAPLRSFSLPCSPYFAELARDPQVEALLELPFAAGAYAARFNYCQTVHEKKIPVGYVTNLAMTRRLLRAQAAWRLRVQQLRESGADGFRRRLKTRGIDLVVFNKTVVVERTPPDDFSVIWQPFGRVRHRLLPPRQTGAFTYRPVGDRPLRSALHAALGEPLHEDDWIVVFQGP